jgi:limonene-1,2-epoxide hydrolase
MKRFTIPSVLLFAACAGRPLAVDPMVWHAESLKATEPAEIGSPAPGSAAEKAAVEKFRAFFGDLNEADIKATIRSVYAPDTRFNDTLKYIRGVDALEPYMVETARNVDSCKVEFEEVIPTPSGVFIRWRMGIRFKKFHKGETQWSIGMSHLRFDREGRIAYHQDYWDAGANIFEKIPVLGAGIRAVKRRL